jgi:hypothetical protein
MSSDALIRQKDEKALWRLGVLLAIAAGIAFVSLVAASGQGATAAVGIGVLIFLAAFAGGSFFGFLFGVPRVLANDADRKTPDKPQPPAGGQPPPEHAAPAEQQAAVARVRLLSSNTNLERISDWLTTLLVGAGLVELHNANDALVQFRLFLESSARVFPVAGGAPTAGSLPAVGPVVLILGIGAGFLFMYLNTRLVLVRLFHAIEVDLSREELPPSEQRAVQAIARDAEAAGSAVAKKAASGGPVTVEDALGLMFDLLYKGDPDRVLELAARLSNTDAVNRPDYWFYQAAALGQKLHGLERDTPEWASTREKALDAARRAIVLSPSYRERLWRISDPQSTDNDLAPLRDDDEFRRLVGQPRGGG